MPAPEGMTSAPVLPPPRAGARTSHSTYSSVAAPSAPKLGDETAAIDGGAAVSKADRRIARLLNLSTDASLGVDASFCGWPSGKCAEISC
jgi:hypothetical protein